ncbi:MAG: DUF4340 domain-containing protein [Spirochaetota bacterium]|nr:DUF4340 domain-containing protein [Spirochaetota bacterium]
MKKDFLKLFALFITLLVLILIILFINVIKKENNNIKFRSHEILHFNLENAVKIELVIKNKKLICNKTDNKWIITFPERFSTDEETVNKLLKSFSNMRYNKILKKDDVSKDELEYKLKLKDFGLDNPETFFSVWTSDGKKLTLYRGIHFSGGIYAKNNLSDDIYVINNKHFSPDNLEQHINNLRDKDFLKLNEPDIKEVIINRIRFNKHKGKWLINDLKKEKTDTFKTGEVISDLLNIRARSFIQSKDVKYYNIPFNEKSIHLTIKIKDRAIEFFMSKHNSKVFVKGLDNPIIYEISALNTSSFNNIFDSFTRTEDYYTINN